MDEKLTVRQQAVLDAIRELRAAKDLPPTLREIAEAVGLKSVASAKYQIDQLKAMGYLEQRDNISRGISLNAQGSSATADSEAPATSSNNVVAGNFKSYPLLGKIAAGVPLLAQENIDDHITLPESLVGKGDIFLLKVKGESMIDAAIMDGDIIAVRQQATADNNDIVAALVDDSATVKVFKQADGHTWLLPRNSAFEPILGDHAQIMGKVTAVLRSI
ncbi:MAG: transcriptional repressor LexA [Actinomycetota bacterium]|jgi:repressor LexA